AGKLPDLPGNRALSAGGGLMSEGSQSDEERAASARRGPMPGGGPGHATIGMPVQKPINFRASTRRLLGRLAPHRVALLVALALTFTSVVLNAIGPLILAVATNLIFAGAFSAQISEDVTQEEAVADLRAQGDDNLADMLAAMEN